MIPYYLSMNTNNIITWGYIAGFIDCDGWISCSKKNEKKYYIIGFIQNIKRIEYMREIYRFLKEHRINVFHITRSNKNSTFKGGTVIQLHIKERDSVVRLIVNILPFLLIKKEKALECLKYVIKPDETYGTSRYWKRKEIHTLKRLYKQKIELNEIAKQMNRTINSIKYQLSKLGINKRIKPHFWANNEIELLKKLVDMKKTNKEIGFIFNRSPESIGSKLSKLGVKRKS